MRRPFLLAILILLPISGLLADPIIVPSVGVQADIALEQKTIWFVKVQVPIMWTDLGTFGVSLVPDFAFNGTDFHGSLGVEGTFALPLRESEGADVFLHSGVGLAGYRHDGRSEILPQATCGASLLIHQAYVRLSAETMVMTKYYRNIDTFASLMVGYGIGKRESP